MGLLGAPIHKLELCEIINYNSFELIIAFYCFLYVTKA